MLMLVRWAQGASQVEPIWPASGIASGLTWPGRGGQTPACQLQLAQAAGAGDAPVVVVDDGLGDGEVGLCVEAGAFDVKADGGSVGGNVGVA